MSQLRLVYSQTVGRVTKPSRKKSTPPSLVLAASQLLSWKIECLREQRPAAVDVIEKLVDDLLKQVEERTLRT